MRESISTNKFSLDLQALDAMRWLKANQPEAYVGVIAKMPEYPYVVMDGSEWAILPDEAWRLVDGKLDPEWGSWLVEAIEQTGFIMWEDGEPFIGTEDDEEEG